MAVASSASPRAVPPSRRFARRAVSAEPSVVYVAGAVAKPGLYRLGPEARAADAVAAAGGMRSSADSGGVNLAARLRDGDEVFVPALGETPRTRTRMRARSTSGRSRTPAPPALALDVNAAGEDQLAAVPGIGRALAARIVALREADGAFTTLDELLDVSGMTQSRLERAKPYLTTQ